MLVDGKFKHAEKGRALVNFLNWALDEGQEEALVLDFAPLPASLGMKVRQKIATLKFE